MKKKASCGALSIAVALGLFSTASVSAVGPTASKNSKAPVHSGFAATSNGLKLGGINTFPVTLASGFKQASTKVGQLVNESLSKVQEKQPAKDVENAVKELFGTNSLLSNTLQQLKLPSTYVAGSHTDFATASTVDNTRPSVWFNTPDNEQALNTNGTISVGAFDDVSLQNIQLTILGTGVSKNVTDIASKNGTLSVPVTDLGLADGAYTLRATATDTAGNVSVVADRNFTIDTTAPALNTVTFGSIPITDGMQLKGSDTFKAEFAEVNPLRTYVEVDQLVNNKWSKVKGQWSTGNDAKAATLPVDTNSLLPYTTYQLKISSDDAAGNHTGFATTFTVDNTRPSVWFNTPDNEQALNTNGTISVGAFDDVSLQNIQLTILGTGVSKNVTDIASKNGTLSVPVADLGLADGAYTLRATATDTAGNVSVVADRNFTIDTTAPVLNTVTFGSTPVTNGMQLKGSDTFKAEFAEANPLWTYVEVDQLVNNKWSKVSGEQSTGDDAKAATLSLNTSSLLPYTMYQLKISSDDAAGNHTGFAATFTVDNTRPSVWFNTPDNEQALNTNGTISVGAFDDVSLQNIQLTILGTGVSKNVTDIASKNGTLSVPVADLGLADGAYTLRATATDTAGNVSFDADRNFTIDTTAPVLNTVTFGSTPVTNGIQLKGSDVFTANFAEANPLRTYVEVDQLVNGKWSKVKGQWSTGDTAKAATLSFNTSSLLPYTTYQLKISSDDAAGNHTGFAATFTVDNN